MSAPETRACNTAPDTDARSREQAAMARRALDNGVTTDPQSAAIRARVRARLASLEGRKPA